MDAHTLMPMRAIRAAAKRHPQVVDTAFALLLAGLLAPVTAEAGGTSGWGWVWFAALHLPLVWRRRTPVIVFWSVVAVAFVATDFAAMGPALLVVPMVASYAVARYRPRRYLWPAAALVVPLTVGWVWNGGPWWDVVALAALFAASTLLGMTIQTRRAYLAELEERARRLEHEREQQARLAIAAERARIAREMHDIVAHNLAVMVALADGAAATTPVAPQRAVDLMEKASATGREALAEIRRLVGLLRADESDRQPGDPGGTPPPQPGFDDLDDLIDQVRAAGLKVALTREGVPGDWGPGVGLAAYRIVQEALTNTMKHAGPRARAEVRLRFTPSGLEVEVVDDGGQRVAQPVDGGHGLVGMTERVAPYGGTVTAEPRPGTGWRVRAHLPFEVA